MAKSPPSLSLSLPCASFTHTTPGVSRRLNHSVRMDHWRAAAESQGATLGASLLRGNYPEDCFLFFSRISLLRSPKSHNVSVNRFQAWKAFRIQPLQKKKKENTKKIPSLKKLSSEFCAPLKFLHNPSPAAPEITSSSNPSVPAGDFYTLHGSFYST